MRSFGNTLLNENVNKAERLNTVIYVKHSFIIFYIPLT